MSDFVIETLKRRYFALAKQENYPHSAEITAELDRLEQAIREMQKPTTEARNHQ